MVEGSLEAIYHEDCENYRYQDRHKWNRFLTAATVELAIGYATFEMKTLTTPDRLFVVIAGTLITAIMLRLALKDEADGEGYLRRMARFEKNAAANWEPVAWYGPNGKLLLRLAMALLACVNAWVLLKAITI